MRILVVDDNHDCADMQALLLQSWGHEVRSAYDGTVAFEVAHEFHPDVMLIDIGLPDIDGCTLARKVRGIRSLNAARLFAVSGNGDPEMRQRAADVGFDDYLVKPTDPTVLKELLA